MLCDRYKEDNNVWLCVLVSTFHEGYSKDPQKTKDLVQKQADLCNDRKLASKCVQERSSDIFFAVFVKVRPNKRTGDSFHTFTFQI